MPGCERKASEDFDTVVVGGGIVGLCLTWFLAEEGAAVLCLDLGQNAGSTANAGSLHGQMQSRMDRLFPDRVRDYQRTLSIYPRAIDYWAEIAERLDSDVEFGLGGGLMVAETEAELDGLAQKSRMEKKHGVDTNLLGRDEVFRMAPYLSRDVRGALYCAKEGKVNPLKANAAIRRQAIARGGELRGNARVSRIEPASSGYTVDSDVGRFRAARVVIAAGAGAGAVAATLGIRLPTRAEPLHMNITDAMQPFMPHLIQHAGDALTMKQLKTGQILIGGGWPAREGEDGGTPTVRIDSLLGNLALAAHLVPGLRDCKLTRTWAGVNPTTDLLSVLGEIAALPGIFVAVPGDCGYTLGPYCARLIVDCMSGRPTDYSLEHFSPQRFASPDRLRAGARPHVRAG